MARIVIYTYTQTPISIQTHRYVRERTVGRLNIVLSDDVERKLRFAIVEAYGGRKGDLSEAIEEAVNEWLEKQGKESEPRPKRK